MHRNSNITDNLNDTFHNVGILDFRHLQRTDFQYLFRCENTPSFTGKEKDSETGLYYFGARYYDPSISGLFLSVDPMADKYSSISPYAYCAWNPVKLVDPDGKDTINGTQSKMLSRACKSSYPGMLIFNGHGVPPDEFSPSTSIRFENDRYFAYDGMINMKTSSTIKMFSDFLSEYNDVYKKILIKDY